MINLLADEEFVDSREDAMQALDDLRNIVELKMGEAQEVQPKFTVEDIHYVIGQLDAAYTILESLNAESIQADAVVLLQALRKR